MHSQHVTTATSYGVALGSFIVGLLNYFTPEQWSAVGVLAGVVIALLTMAIDAHFKKANAQAYRDYLKSRLDSVLPEDLPGK